MKRERPIDHTESVRHFYEGSFAEQLSNADFECFKPIRVFNNFIKTILINEYINLGDVVLDIGAGKGQDLNKFHHKQIRELVHVDASSEQVAEAQRRYNENRT